MDKPTTHFYFDSIHDNASSGSPSGHMMASRAIQDLQLEYCLECNNMLPGTQPEIIFSNQWSIVPFRIRNRKISATWQHAIRIRNRNWNISSNWTCYDNLVFFWIGSDVRGSSLTIGIRQRGASFHRRWYSWQRATGSGTSEQEDH